MARKPVDEIAKMNKRHGREGAWIVIRKQTSTFTVADIANNVDLSKGSVLDYLKALAAAGILEIAKSETNGAITVHHYRLLKDVGAETPRVRADGSEVTQGRGVEAMWRTIKLLSSFTADELALTASTASTIIKPNTAADYLKHLSKAGYVRRTANRFSFVKSRDPGPLAPQIQRVKQVFDPNSKTVVWPKGGAA